MQRKPTLAAAVAAATFQTAAFRFLVCLLIAALAVYTDVLPASRLSPPVAIVTADLSIILSTAWFFSAGGELYQRAAAQHRLRKSDSAFVKGAAAVMSLAGVGATVASLETAATVLFALYTDTGVLLAAITALYFISYQAPAAA